MQAGDLDAVVRVARTAFPDHYEAPTCFAERFQLFPVGCFVLAAGKAIEGYLIAYPWPLGSIPPLDSLLGGLPNTETAWYLHDLALNPVVRGKGHARPIVERLATIAGARGCQVIALVSVNATLAFWRGMGFVPMPTDAEIGRKLESYGAGATYMTRAV